MRCRLTRENTWAASSEFRLQAVQTLPFLQLRIRPRETPKGVTPSGVMLWDTNQAERSVLRRAINFAGTAT